MTPKLVKELLREMRCMHIDLDKLKTVTPIKWRDNLECPNLQECIINDQMVAWLEPRPNYCDRGHWKVECPLPDIDAADSFPRYYMSEITAIQETEKFLKWRLWKIRAEKPMP